MVILVNVARVVVVVLLWLHLRLIDPSAEVAGLESSSLSGSEPALGVSVFAHRVLSREKFSSNLSVAL